jgi:hypothetical protein
MNLYTKGESLSPIFQQSSRHGVAWGGGGVKGGLGVGGGERCPRVPLILSPPPLYSASKVSTSTKVPHLIIKNAFYSMDGQRGGGRAGGRDVISQDLHCPMRKKF